MRANLPELSDYQQDAVDRMKNGCILCGGVGSGKTRTSLAYYRKIFKETGCITPLYVITTAKKRDSRDWEDEASEWGIPYVDKFTVDSWNNIGKYEKVHDAFFIFDEQRVVGKGAWVKSFLEIAKRNRWILLSATPGDTWSDYIPVFIANGFYRHRTEFTREHIVYSSFTRFPKIDRYLATAKLERLRDSILVQMDYKPHTKRVYEDVWCDYDISEYRSITRMQWNPFEDKPIDTASELCYVQRRVCNGDPSRIKAVEKLLAEHPKMVIFYNFDYELEVIRAFCEAKSVPWGELNGHKHEKIPGGEKWLYLVQYMSGAEAWNCTETDTMIFYSQNYSYRILEQASGRIDRRNTPYDILHYYCLKSRSGIDLAIARALRNKKDFNERGYASFGSGRK